MVEVELVFIVFVLVLFLEQILLYHRIIICVGYLMKKAINPPSEMGGTGKAEALLRVLKTPML